MAEAFPRETEWRAGTGPAGATPPTTEELERLERVARGEITTDEAIAEIRHRIQGV